MKEETFDSYPPWIMVLSTLLGVSVYAIGAFILSGFGAAFAAAYVLYCLLIEYRIIKGSCVNCHYFGKACGLGKGRICSMFFKKGDPKKFAEKEASMNDLLPDLMVSLMPMAAGIILLIKDFSWILLAALAAIAALSTMGNAVVRGKLLCNHCRQRLLGCPAQKLFGKTKK